MPGEREVVITGVGIASPIGIGREAFWASLAAGKSGVRRSEALAKVGFPVQIAAEVLDFDGKQFVTPRKSLKVMCREIQLAYAAATLAVQDAGLNTAALDHDRFGCVLGCDMLYCDNEDVEDVFRSCLVDGQFDWQRWGENFPSKIFPLWMLKYLPNMAACHIGIALDGRGPNNTITLGDASSLLAIHEAAHVIARGHADVMLAGGTGSRLNVTPLAYRGEKLLSHRQDEPEKASRPFDAGRDGLVNGEGAGILLLESREHADARGAKILCRYVAGRSSFVAPNDGALNSELSIRNAIRGVMEATGLSAKEIGHVSAHGLSTKLEDQHEAAAIAATLGDVTVFAPKSYFGNLGTGSGAIELAASVLALAHNEVPATLNYETPDPACPVNVNAAPLRNRPRTAICLSQSTSGQAAAVVLQRE
jgi:3-oxoacyl-[acyl-carrier-protein] synthase II